jgi:hypothetical protein
MDDRGRSSEFAFQHFRFELEGHGEPVSRLGGRFGGLGELLGTRTPQKTHRLARGEVRGPGESVRNLIHQLVPETQRVRGPGRGNFWYNANVGVIMIIDSYRLIA